MQPTTEHAIYTRITKLEEEKNSIQKSIDRLIQINDVDYMEFIEIWAIDIQNISLQIDFYKKQLFSK